MKNQNKWKIDFRTVFFSILSLILFNLAIFIPEQRLIISGFFTISIILAIIFFYINKINYNEESIKIIKNSLKEISDELTEKFNYLKELYNLKVEIEMLKKRGKKAEINLLDVVKIIVAIILIYVIIEVIRSVA